MQLFIRRGAPSQTLVLEVDPSQDVASLKAQLNSTEVSCQPDDLVLFHAGRVLDDQALLSECRLSHGSTVHASGRLRGGGGDGGSTGAESRSCYLEMYKGKAPDKVNPMEGLLARWTRCHISGADLTPPCVIDELGTLYNKDALIQALISKTLPSGLSYITGLKSVTELKLTPHSSAGLNRPKAAEKGLHMPGNESPFCCPITGLEFNGRFKFQVHRPTGMAISEKAIKEAAAVVEEMVGWPYKSDDWIPVNPIGEQLEALKVAQAAKMAAEREKKAKKAAAKLATATIANNSNGTAIAITANGATHPKHGSAGLSSPDGMAIAASMTAVGNKRGSPGVEVGGNGSSVAAAGLDGEAKRPKLAGVKNGSSSSVYASIFTSSIQQPVKETYCCRSTSARGMHLS